MPVSATPDEVLKLGLVLVGYGRERQKRVRGETNHSRFRSNYGFAPLVYAQIWNDLQVASDDAARIDATQIGVTLENFLFSLLFLKTYPTEEQLAGRWGYCETIVRKWAWFFLDKIAALRATKIVWPAQWDTIFTISVDGVHCRYHEEKHPTLSKDTKLYSHKFNGPGLSYEIALDLFTSRCVWVHGPFKAGKSDKSIYKSKLRGKIPQGKKAVADGGYICSKWPELATPNHNDPELLRTFKARARMRQESFHTRVKQFQCLNVPFRHSFKKHQTCFMAACVIAQYDVELCTPLFDV